MNALKSKYENDVAMSKRKRERERKKKKTAAWPHSGQHDTFE